MERIEGVVVCGAGPVGLVTALKLAQGGIRVVVLDAADSLSAQPRAAVYHSPVVERLDSLGLLTELRTIGVLKQGYHYWTRDHELLGHLDMRWLRPQDTAYPYNLHLGQPALAAIILKHLLRLPGAEVRWRHRVVALDQSDSHVTVTAATPAGPQDIAGELARRSRRHSQRGSPRTRARVRGTHLAGMVCRHERTFRFRGAWLRAIQRRAGSGPLGHHP